MRIIKSSLVDFVVEYGCADKDVSRVKWFYTPLYPLLPILHGLGSNGPHDCMRNSVLEHMRLNPELLSLIPNHCGSSVSYRDDTLGNDNKQFWGAKGGVGVEVFAVSGERSKIGNR